MGQRPVAGSVWRASAGAAASVSPLLALDPAPSVADATPLLTLVGAERETLAGALRAWGAARDEEANHAWRRPGGLTRLAGL